MATRTWTFPALPFSCYWLCWLSGLKHCIFTRPWSWTNVLLTRFFSFEAGLSASSSAKLVIVISTKVIKMKVWTPRRDTAICQKWVLLVYWAQIHNHNLAAIADRSLSCILHLREAQQIRVPRLLDIRINLYKEVSGIILWPMGWGLPDLFNQNCATISSFVHLQNKQKISIKTSWDA